MNTNISAVNLNNGEQSAKQASVNVKNNKVENKGVFSSAVVSGIQSVQNARIDGNTYNSLLQDVSSVEEQIKASATTTKENLGALVKRLSGADYVKMDEEGFNINDAEPEEMINIVERIKIMLAAYCDDYNFVDGTIDSEMVKDVVGSTTMADQIEDKMSNVNYPVSEEAIAEVEEALEQAKELRPLTAEEKKYIVSNNLQPTIANIYKAEHIGAQDTRAKKELSMYEWRMLEPQIKTVIKGAGLNNPDRALVNARSFVEGGIYVTKENLKLMEKLDEIDLNNMESDDKQQEVMEKIVVSMTEGNYAIDADITSEKSAYQKVADAIKTLNQADVHETLAVTEDDKEFTIGNLSEAVQNNSGSQMSDYEVAKEYQKLAQNSKALANYIQLQEIRILMTAQAGLSLVKQGFNLDITPIAQLVDELKMIYEREVSILNQNMNRNNVYNGLNMLQSLPTTIFSSNSELSYTPAQMVFEVKKSIEDIKNAPDVTVGAVVKERQENENITISDFAQTGNSMKQRFKEAGEAYEALGTEVRSDLGDSFERAVDSSTTEILTQLGLEDTRGNRDAVRILGYNQMEITNESVDQIKEVYSTLNNLIDNMKPETVLNMIRNNINPMEADIEVVNEYLQKQNENVDSMEKYSRFLYKLERTNGISEQEREQFIGIYKMLNTFREDAGNAVGALLKQSAEVTMSNLMTVYQNSKSVGVDTTVDNDTDLSKYSGTVNYYRNLFDVTAENITPDTLKKTNEKQPVMEQLVESFCENINEAYDSKTEAEYYKEYAESIKKAVQEEQSVIRELTENDQKITINNMAAVENIMNSEYFTKLYQIANERDDKDFAKLLNEFVEKTGDKEELEAAYDELQTKCDEIIDEAILSEKPQEYKEIENLRMLGKEISLINSLSKRNNYKIPFNANGEIGTINLSLVQDEQNKGRISVEMQTDALGKISVEAQIITDIFGSTTAVVNAVTQKSTEDMEAKVNAVKELLEGMGFAECNVNLSVTSSLPDIHCAGQGVAIPSDKLYEVPKNIILGFL